VLSSIVESVVEKGGLRWRYESFIVSLMWSVGMGNPTVCKEKLFSEATAILTLCQAS